MLRKTRRPRKLRNPRPSQTNVEGFYGGVSDSSERVRESAAGADRPNTFAGLPLSCTHPTDKYQIIQMDRVGRKRIKVKT